VAEQNRSAWGPDYTDEEDTIPLGPPPPYEADEDWNKPTGSWNGDVKDAGDAESKDAGDETVEMDLTDMSLPSLSHSVLSAASTASARTVLASAAPADGGALRQRTAEAALDAMRAHDAASARTVLATAAPADGGALRQRTVEAALDAMRARDAAAALRGEPQLELPAVAADVEMRDAATLPPSGEPVAVPLQLPLPLPVAAGPARNWAAANATAPAERPVPPPLPPREGQAGVQVGKGASDGDGKEVKKGRMIWRKNKIVKKSS
jgi:hypothetical protein